MQDEYIQARMEELAGVFRPGGRAPTEAELREFTVKMMREDCSDAGIAGEEFEAALADGTVEALHRKARDISLAAFEASSARRDKVRRLQLAGLLLLTTGFLVFLYRSF